MYTGVQQVHLSSDSATELVGQGFLLLDCTTVNQMKMGSNDRKGRGYSNSVWVSRSIIMVTNQVETDLWKSTASDAKDTQDTSF